MTSKELNLALIKAFPEIQHKYSVETTWQDGDETGSHIVFEDVFVPYIRKQISIQNDRKLEQIFEHIESLLNLNDAYIEEVIVFSVIEPLVYDDSIEDAVFLPYVKPRTLAEVEALTLNKL